MKKLRPFLLIPLLAFSTLLICTDAHAQLLTQGGAFSVFQQMDNSSILPQNWSRSVGIGHFNSGGIVPRSFLHVSSQFNPLPQNGSITSVSETFRTTVGSATSQFWRMERDVNEIGRLWHVGSHRAFRLMAPEPRDDGQDRYSGVIIENSNEDGLWVIHNGPPTGGRAFPNPAPQLLNRTGYAALGWHNAWLFTPVGVPRGPWSRFHLFHEVMGTRPLFAFRSQMQNGVTMTGNSDLGYFGQWYDRGANGTGPEVDDNSNLVIATSEDALPQNQYTDWDNISFRFMGDLAAPATGTASSTNGLEMLRISPFKNNTGLIEGLVGIGDFLGTGAQPNERLDVLDRTIRLRDFSPVANLAYLNQAVNVNRVLVADQNDGTVYWRPMTDFLVTPLTDCDWTPSGANFDLISAQPGAPLGCPNESSIVGIGLAGPNAKLHVVNDMTHTTRGTNLWLVHRPSAGSGGNVAAEIVLAPTASEPQGSTHVGVDITTINGRDFNFGCRAAAEINDPSITTTRSEAMTADNISRSGNMLSGYGVRANSLEMGGTIGTSIGVYGQAVGTNIAYGVFGVASGATTNWAGYFPGKVYATTYIGSDAALKTNVQDLQGATSLIEQLAPKTYEYRTADYPSMALDAGSQVGLIAQEVELVLPELVKEAVQPAELDSTGSVVTPEVSFKALNYTGLVPVLVGAIKEQNMVIDQLTQRLDQMEQQLSLCCIDIGTVDPRSENEGTDLIGIGRSDLSIVPNPFTERTTVSYVLAQAGQMQLQVASNTGRKLATLQEGWRDAGEHTYDWVTSDLAPGMYFVTLLLDGEPLMKKTVKVE